ncbi:MULTISPECIES: glycoside hydrolase family 15 protein [unclassified Oceanispirochaeta]|uniref:glycoside hydrolase family 15 protein n=1 Tax=unclassified Oceanispirochaeta TaxID=2635722 RepID=UPI000E091474|nr:MULTISPECIES: glycoside hydrolase family 15 protein [unclassified Oceanispirochaeta]MBF9018001.1 glycoside hydrolase [Oceanispirochaeta sp. M2]NPD74513.1 glycoside hydrolase [Oceanispirochaeta sp. M1]RDG29626.1 glycoside hydrolase [Oceanispirochaeta sp. M1]
MDNRQFLRQISLEQILRNQTEEGAIIAGSSFSQYNYSWFRDGAFIAYAMIGAGKMEEAEKFISWGNRIILKSSEKIAALQEKLLSSRPLDIQDFLGARYTAQGNEDESDWPNFQIDGYGTWLWCMSEYMTALDAEELPSSWKSGVELIVSYLKMVWRLPNSDCWEEFSDKIHPATLSCVYGGLKAVSPWLDDPELPALTEEVKAYVYDNLHKDGYFPKFIGSDLVDASLLWISLPFGMADVNDPVMKKTVEKIEEDLLEEGGVKRYSEDTYYGGGQWIIHSCWMAWYYYETGRYEEAETLMEWVVCRQKKDGSLPEQTTDITNEPSMVKEWEQRWGTVATPLTWSHAMFLIVDQVSQLYTEKKGVLSYEN